MPYEFESIKCTEFSSFLEEEAEMRGLKLKRPKITDLCYDLCVHRYLFGIRLPLLYREKASLIANEVGEIGIDGLVHKFYTIPKELNGGLKNYVDAVHEKIRQLQPSSQ